METDPDSESRSTNGSKANSGDDSDSDDESSSEDDSDSGDESSSEDDSDSDDFVGQTDLSLFDEGSELNLAWVHQALGISRTQSMRTGLQDMSMNPHSALPNLDDPIIARIAKACGNCPFNTREQALELCAWIYIFFSVEMISQTIAISEDSSHPVTAEISKSYGVSKPVEICKIMVSARLPTPGSKPGTFVFGEKKNMSVEELRTFLRKELIRIVDVDGTLAMFFSVGEKGRPHLQRIVQKTRSLLEADGKKAATRETVEHVAMRALQSAYRPEDDADRTIPIGVVTMVKKEVEALNADEREALKTAAHAFGTAKALTPSPQLAGQLSKELLASAAATGEAGVDLKWSLYDRGIELVSKAREMGTQCTFRRVHAEDDLDDLSRLRSMRIISFPVDASRPDRDWDCYDVVKLHKYVVRQIDRDHASDKANLMVLLKRHGKLARHIHFPPPSGVASEGVGKPFNEVDVNRLQLWHEAYVTLQIMQQNMSAQELQKLDQFAAHLVPAAMVDQEAGWTRWAGRKLWNMMTYKYNPTRFLVKGTHKMFLSWLPWLLANQIIITIVEALLCMIAKFWVTNTFFAISPIAFVSGEIRETIQWAMQMLGAQCMQHFWDILCRTAKNHPESMIVASVIGWLGEKLRFKPAVALASWMQRSIGDEAAEAVKVVGTLLGALVLLSMGQTVLHVIPSLLGSGAYSEQTFGSFVTTTFLNSMVEYMPNMPIIGPIYNLVVTVKQGTASWMTFERTAGVVSAVAGAMSMFLCKFLGRLSKGLGDSCQQATSFIARSFGSAAFSMKVVRILWDVSYLFLTGGKNFLLTPCLRNHSETFHQLSIYFDRSKPLSATAAQASAQHTTDDTQMQPTLEKFLAETAAKSGSVVRESLETANPDIMNATQRYQANDDVKNYWRQVVRDEYVENYKAMHNDQMPSNDDILLHIERATSARTSDEIMAQVATNKKMHEEMSSRLSQTPVFTKEQHEKMRKSVPSIEKHIKQLRQNTESELQQTNETIKERIADIGVVDEQYEESKTNFEKLERQAESVRRISTNGRNAIGGSSGRPLAIADSSGNHVAIADSYTDKIYMEMAEEMENMIQLFDKRKELVRQINMAQLKSKDLSSMLSKCDWELSIVEEMHNHQELMDNSEPIGKPFKNELVDKNKNEIVSTINSRVDNLIALDKARGSQSESHTTCDSNMTKLIRQMDTAQHSVSTKLESAGNMQLINRVADDKAMDKFLSTITDKRTSDKWRAVSTQAKKMIETTENDSVEVNKFADEVRDNIIKRQTDLRRQQELANVRATSTKFYVGKTKESLDDESFILKDKKIPLGSEPKTNADLNKVIDNMNGKTRMIKERAVIMQRSVNLPKNCGSECIQLVDQALERALQNEETRAQLQSNPDQPIQLIYDSTQQATIEAYNRFESYRIDNRNLGEEAIPQQLKFGTDSDSEPSLLNGFLYTESTWKDRVQYVGEKVMHKMLEGTLLFMHYVMVPE